MLSTAFQGSRVSGRNGPTSVKQLPRHNPSDFHFDGSEQEHIDIVVPVEVSDSEESALSF